MDWVGVSDEVLEARLIRRAASERGSVVEFLHELHEVEVRSIHLRDGYPSMFAYCTRKLRLSTGDAWRRTNGARLLARFPAAGEMLVSGRLSLASFCELRNVLDDENHVELLGRAVDLTEEQVKRLVVALAPREEPAPMLRRLHQPPAVAAEPKLPAPPPLSPAEVEAIWSTPAAPAQALSRVAAEPTAGESVAAPAVAPLPARPPRIEPVAPGRSVVRFTMSDAERVELEEARALLSHRVPDGNLAEVYAACVRLALGCGSTWQVQVHHVMPAALGVPPTLDTIGLRCRAHNIYEAELDFGRDHMRQFRRNLPHPARPPPV